MNDYKSGPSLCGKPIGGLGFDCNRELEHPGYCSYTTPAIDLAPQRSRRNKDQSDRNAEAAEWIQMRIRQAIKEAEREFGVYVAVGRLTTRAGYIDDVHSVSLTVNIWPESMRIIETERESKAIG